MSSVFINTVFITSSPRVVDIVICLRFSMVLHSMSSEAREYLHVGYVLLMSKSSQ